MESIATFIEINPTLIKVGIIVVGYFVTFVLTSFLIKKIVLSGKKKQESEQENTQKVPDKREIRDGYIIGKCENIIILSFILVGEVTGLALIFAAKNLARQKDIRENAGFFLAGTMVNFTATLVIAYILKYILQLVP
jgi:phage shock protein PspC (stress-responsive transcriptional regulator)